MKITRSQLAEYILGHRGKAAISRVAAYLVSSGRGKEAELLLREVEAKLAKTGLTVAHVASARKLEAEEQQNIVELLKKQTETKSVEVINEIDLSLLGGVIVRTPGREVDLSIRHRLDRLKRA